MKDNFKILLSILVVVLILGVWLYIFYTDESSTAFEKLTGTSQTTAISEQIDNPPVDKIKQYRMNYNYSGDQDLIIDLLQGESTFAMEYEGSGHFKVRLLDNRDNLIKQIADSTGPYRNLFTLSAPYTGPYLLEVRAGAGPWRVEHR